MICAVGAFGIAHLLPQWYTAESSLIVDAQHFAIPELQGALSADNAPDPMPYIRSEAEVIASRPMLLQVIGELHLATDPDFNPMLRAPTFWDQAISYLKSLPDRLFAQTGLGPAMLQHGAAESEREALLTEAANRLVVAHDPRSLVINVSFTARNPELASRFVNTVVRDYMDLAAKSRASVNKDANSALTQRLDQVRQDVNAIEEKVRETRTKAGLISVRAGSVGQQRLELLTDAAVKANLERTSAEDALVRAQAAVSAGTTSDLANVLDSSTIGGLRQQEAQAARLAAEMEVHFGPSYPARRSAEANLASIRQRISEEVHRLVSSLQMTVQAKREQERQTRAELEQTRAAASEMATTQADLAQLEHDAEARRAVYKTLLERAEQTSADPRTMQAPVGTRVVSPAAPPEDPTSPRPKLAGGLGLLGGMLFGGLVTLARGRNGAGVQTAADLTEETGLPVLAVVPRLGPPALTSRVLTEPAGASSEALRSLRTRLRFAQRRRATRSVVFVSAGRGEGTSSLAAAFARVAAADGERVLLIEGDLHRPALARLLGRKGGRLSGVLDGTVPWREAVERDGETPLDLLLADRPLAGAYGHLSGMRFQNLLADANEDYNLIVLDAPASTLASDAMALAFRTDATVLVVRAGRGRRRLLKEAAERLVAAARSPVACALNMAG